jgi:hypothetical protein
MKTAELSTMHVIRVECGVRLLACSLMYEGLGILLPWRFRVQTFAMTVALLTVVFVIPSSPSRRLLGW